MSDAEVQQVLQPVRHAQLPVQRGPRLPVLRVW
jgi:hypothetical protein